MIPVRSCGQAAAYRGERLHDSQRFLDAVLPGEPSGEAIEHIAIDWLASRLYRLGRHHHFKGVCACAAPMSASPVAE